MAARRYWRLRVVGTNGGGFSGNTLILLTEIEMRVAVGGVDQCSGGTAIGQKGFASGTSEDPASAFDNNTGTWWQGWWNNTGDATRPRPCAVGYDFGAGNAKDIVEIGVSLHPSYLDRSPRIFFVEASDDGVTWDFQWLATPKTWSSGAMRSFARPVEQSANRCWMVYSRPFERETWNGNYSCAEMKFFEDGVDVTSGGTPLGDVQFQTNTPNLAFDGNNSTYYASGASDSAWLGYDFGADNNRDISSVSFRARADFDGQALQSGQLFYSQDGTNWLPDWSFLSLPQWNVGEQRTFSEGAFAGKNFWRVVLLTRQGGTSVALVPMGVHEVQFRLVAGTPSTNFHLVDGVAVASGVFQSDGNYQPGRAFDGVVTGDLAFVADNIHGSSVDGRHWIGMQFPANREVAEVAITARTTYQDDSPTSFMIQYSEDHGLSWTTTNTYSGLTWTSGQTRTFAVSGTSPSSTRRRQSVVC